MLFGDLQIKALIDYVENDLKLLIKKDRQLFERYWKNGVMICLSVFGNFNYFY